MELRQVAFKRIKSLAFSGLVLTLLGVGCANQATSPGLVNTNVLGSFRGYHFARVQTHFHSPFSFDACDSNGLDTAGTPNATCLQHIKGALCTNHINLTFVTDHVDHLAEYDFSKLVMVESGDTTVYNSAVEPIGNQIGCADGFAAILSPGLEGKMLALGMEHHILGTLATRQAVYGGESGADRATIVAESDAIVGIPHTESRDLATITAVGPSFIEIYNVHANTDPKIRKKSLGLPPFEHIAKFLNYLVDPLKELNPDFFFMEFFEMSDLYLQKWNTLLAGGNEIAGVAGLDSHENTFSQKAADGERLDSHRRMTRFISNFVVTTDDQIATIRNAIKVGRTYFVLEGLGTPRGLDFYGTVGATTVEMNTGVPPTVGVQASTIVATVPTLHSSSLFMDYDDLPLIVGELHYINASGVESVVATARGGEQMVYVDPPTGHYRLHVYMYPVHLYNVIFSKKNVGKRYPWVTSNPVRVIR